MNPRRAACVTFVAGLLFAAPIGAAGGERILVFLVWATGMFFCGVGCWIGWNVAHDHLADEHARALALATHEAYDEGRWVGRSELLRPAPAGRPYDQDAGR